MIYLEGEISKVPKQILKVLIHVGEMVMPIGIKIGMPQYGYIMT
jgi:protein-L-isoaspartate O-methyltransferase